MPLLAPLPATPFELAEWKQATVQFNYHIAVDRMFYSVPYQYIKNKVDVRITDTTVEIFYNHNRIASHRRLHGRSGQYSTVTEHMPQEHQNIWNGTATGSANGQIRLELTQVRLSMQYLPPAGLNNNPIEAVWDC